MPYFNLGNPVIKLRRKTLKNKKSQDKPKYIFIPIYVLEERK